MMMYVCCHLQSRNVVVFYGSQTGTAEEFAGRLARDATRYGMKAIVADPEESDMVIVLHILCCCLLQLFIHSLLSLHKIYEDLFYTNVRHYVVQNIISLLQ